MLEKTEEASVSDIVHVHPFVYGDRKFCRKCKKEKSIHLFITQRGKVGNVCSNCKRLLKPNWKDRELVGHESS
jgi:hypothetical protein